MEINEYILPANWASALINGDYSGMSDLEEEALNLWMDHNKPGYCINCVPWCFCSHHDAWGIFPYAGDCSKFSFHKPPSLKDKFIGKRVISIGSPFQEKVLIVKDIIEDKASVVFESIGDLPFLVDANTLEIVQEKRESITVTIAYGQKKLQYHRVRNLGEIPEYLKKWKECNNVKNSELRSSHGEVRIDGVLVGQCTNSWTLPIAGKLF